MASSDAPRDFDASPSSAEVFEKIERGVFIVVALAATMNLLVQLYDGQFWWWCTLGSLLWVVTVIRGIPGALRHPHPHALAVVLAIQAVLAVTTVISPAMPPRIFAVIVAMAISAMLLPIRASLTIAVAMGTGLVGVLSWQDIQRPAHPLPHPVWILVPFSLSYLASVTVRQSIVSRLVAERMSAKLHALNQELKVALESANELATSRERTRIARELHDSIGHCLTTGNVHLEAAQKFMSRGLEERAERALKRAREATHTGLEELRSCVSLLREPRELSSLSESISDLLHAFPAEHYASRFELVGQERRVEAARQFALFRVTQEALTNIARHAQAQTIDITLSYGADHVALEIRDDGVGCAEPHDAPGHGLRGIEERVTSLQGTLSIHTAPDQGFVIEARIPT